MEKAGFVYIWYDRKRKRFYIGSHWGREDDGYVCSSAWMMQAYARRPDDFRRRVLKRDIQSRQELLAEEYKWLSLIKKHEIKVRYYNLHTHHPGHWITSDETRLTVQQKLSRAAKRNHADPAYREKFLASRDSVRKPHSEETKRKRRDAIKATLAIKFPIEERKQSRKRGDPALSQVYSDASKRRWSKPGAKEKASQLSRERLKGVPKEYTKGTKWWHCGDEMKRCRECPGDGWLPGRSPRVIGKLKAAKSRNKEMN